jgi:hypothetical protein
LSWRDGKYRVSERYNFLKPSEKQLIINSLQYGRIISFDFAAAETAIPRHMFDRTRVDGIHFEKINQCYLVVHWATTTDFYWRLNSFSTKSLERDVDTWQRVSNKIDIILSC